MLACAGHRWPSDHPKPHGGDRPILRPTLLMAIHGDATQGEGLSQDIPKHRLLYSDQGQQKNQLSTVSFVFRCLNPRPEGLFLLHPRVPTRTHLFK